MDKFIEKLILVKKTLYFLNIYIENIMKIIDLLNREAEKESYEFRDMIVSFYRNEMPEIPQKYEELYGDDLEQFENLFAIRKIAKTRTFKDFCFDGRRGWNLRAVYYKDEPVCILQNAGREMDDHAELIMINEVLFEQMIHDIEVLIANVLSERNDLTEKVVLNLETEIEGLDCFYGYHIDDEFRHY